MATATLHSQRARPRCCGRGLAWKALLEAGWHGFPASAATKRSEVAPRVSTPRPALLTGGKKVVRATPSFLALVRHGGGQRWTGVRPPFASPFSGSLSPQRSLAGRQSSRCGSRGGHIDHRRCALRTKTPTQAATTRKWCGAKSVPSHNVAQATTCSALYYAQAPLVFGR